MRFLLQYSFLLVFIFGTMHIDNVESELTPPYFNLAEGRKIAASATCGENTDGPELYCKLVGANHRHSGNIEDDPSVIQGQICDYCNPAILEKTHPAEYAIDGTENWWQSPPLSRGMKYNEVNLTIDFGQEFHVAYLFIRMGNSPRPGLWTLEKSNDYGKTYTSWQHFSDSPADCETYFGPESLQPIRRDDDVICTTEYSKIVPLEGGEIPVMLLNNRPSANNYFNSTTLQEWTRATNIRIRLLRTKNLLGHLMSVARQDPTVTRRYFYSIKDISIGGRCVCNGHANTCNVLDSSRSPSKIRILSCQCQHNTCGIQCDECCPGYEQKKWRQNTNAHPFQCEPCNCFGHSNKCTYSEDVDELSQSLDIHGRYEGGGVCQECQDNTEGINCNKCRPTFYRPYERHWNDTDVCQPCNCNHFYSTGNCAEETGLCECRPEFEAPHCDTCSYGYFGYPDCRPCECNLNGTDGYYCEAQDGRCPCKFNFAGDHCNRCADGYYKFPECNSCDCNAIGSGNDTCDDYSGQCQCKSNFDGKQCERCKDGYYDYPTCTYCNCDIKGTEEEVCHKSSGQCLCREGFGGPRCDQCLPGYYNYPDCVQCNCSSVGSVSTVCDTSGRCPCLSNFSGKQCTVCTAGYYQYPDCLPCNCDSSGAVGKSCNADGQCQCSNNFDGKTCNQCRVGFYNYPACEECNCNPSGVIAQFAGCGSVPAGELCQCKERVQGRICDKCRPLYWNLTTANPDGCEECDCFIDGTMGALDTCDSGSGQCSCKPWAAGRSCSECKDGTFDLYGGSLFGCKDCGCDIGGSAHNVCNKANGQCKCHPRIAGRTCKFPLTTHFYPTLFQFQYEYEDGYTPYGTQVRYQFDEALFPGYSKKGYAVFSPLQNEVINEVSIAKSSVYRLVIRYINPNNENVIGQILITSDNPLEVDQTTKVLFKPTKNPEFVSVSGAKGDIPFPVVLDGGRYTISMKTEKSLFLDYFVLLPAAYYEASILTKKIQTPCEVGSNDLCRHYKYPEIIEFNPNYRPYITENDEAFDAIEHFKDYEHLSVINEDNLPVISDSQPKLNYLMDVPHSGRYVLIVDYVTNRNVSDVSILQVNQAGESVQDGGITLYPCTFTTVCRQPVIDSQSREKVFFIDLNDVRPIEVVTGGKSHVAIKSIAAIPYEDWSLDYIQPTPVCVRQNGKCVAATFRNAPDSKKIEFEQEHDDRIALKLPEVYDNSTKLIYLQRENPTIVINSKVLNPGRYVVLIKYYQPNHPRFLINYKLDSNRQIYEDKLSVNHCPSISGCREVIAQRVDIDEGFTFTLTNNHATGVWLDYVLLVPEEQYKESLVQEETFDQTKEFIHKCGQDNFYIPLNASEFCKDAVFSLTADYNSGALPCACDYSGSTSFECESFGGQCQCKPNIIGRQCEACKTGFYGFPECKPCDCPSTALCEKDTGECICPPRVTGEKCDQCMPQTFGFDQIIGCEECNCNPLGVERGNLQCDLNNGSCDCRSNVVGRSCDKCLNGFFNFPHCEACRCDIRGTTFEVCDQVDETCFCKKNVQGRECNHCIEGTYNLVDTNPEGCTKCFCFGKTTRCSSAYLRPFNVSMMKDVSLTTIKISNGKSELIPWVVKEPIMFNDTTARVDLIDVENELLLSGLIYFGSLDFLGSVNSHITSYGGYLTYSIFYTQGIYGSALIGPDVILKSKNAIITHQSYEQPASDQLFRGSVKMVESNFQTLTGGSVTREQFMMVLRDLTAIYIRASYWEKGVLTLLSDVYLTLADDDSEHYDLYSELPVEKCECPPGYSGLSCEDCAPGYYRDPNGPYGGYCIPCQCNGHAETCDCDTGICNDCQHSTIGDNCERCIEGYYGNATNGYPSDCMICACPLPVESNNFAVSCEVSDDGYNIHCECKEGYAGHKCQSCAAGYYGEPEIDGEVCKLCDCSGNINPEEPGSCDSVSGECLRCLNNTYGQACNLCAPGYYGDAIKLKDCQSCVCDKLGTELCDNYIGTCNCYPNVIGEKCDRCEEDHYGYESGRGCLSCDCGIASNSSQCDDQSGACACKPGVTGRQCDRCMPGYWNYTQDGCQPCSCSTEYSVGVGCDAETGQCHCLQGVVGEKCQSCPARWVLIPHTRCKECDGCHHALLDVTDALREELDPHVSEFETKATTFYTSQKLKYYDDLAKELSPKIDRLDTSGVNLKPVQQLIESLEMDAKNLNKRKTYAEQNAMEGALGSDKLLKDASDILDTNRLVNANVRNTIRDVQKLADSLDSSESNTKLDMANSEAESIFNKIKEYKMDPETASSQLIDTEHELKKTEEFHKKVQDLNESLNDLKNNIGMFDSKLEDLYDFSIASGENSAKAERLSKKYKESNVHAKFALIGSDVKETQKNIVDSKALLKNATELLKGISGQHKELDKMHVNLEEVTNALEETLLSKSNEFDNMQDKILRATEHSSKIVDSAEELGREYSNITGTLAIKAARAYSDIADHVEEADNAVARGKLAARNATDLTNGIGNRAGESDNVASELLDEARKSLNLVQTILQPHIDKAVDAVERIQTTNQQTDDQTTAVNLSLDQIPLESQTDTWSQARDTAIKAHKEAQDTLKLFEPLVSQLPNDLHNAKQIPKTVVNTNKNIGQTANQVERVKDLLPNITQRIEDLVEKQGKDDSIISDIGDRIDRLKTQIKMARHLANNVNVGVQFYPNTTLELKAPETLSQIATNSNTSVYFKTDKPNGFILYLGNENKTGAKRAKRDDFMALEIENGYPVLTIDLGNGPERIISDVYSANGKWHKAVVQRNGENVNFFVIEEVDGVEVVHKTSAVLPGPPSEFDVDQDSKLFVGGIPPDYNVQDSLRYSSFEGQIEQLKIGDSDVGLWNFIDGQNNKDGAIERDVLLTKELPPTGFRFGGNGYVIMDARPYSFSQRSNIQIKFKTNRDTTDGLLFYAGDKHAHFISVELRDGTILFQFKLGQDAAVVRFGSQQMFNDDQWHTVEADRDGGRGQLKIDGAVVFQDVKYDSNDKDSGLRISEHMYFGGIPEKLPHNEISSVSFDGCIDGVSISGVPVDLSRHVKAFDIKPGCPVKFSPLISFPPHKYGYLRQQNINASNNIRITLRFKTIQGKGVIFYVANGDQTATFGLTLEDGVLVLRSSKEELNSGINRYNNGEWHHVIATHSGDRLTLIVDDVDIFISESTPPSLYISHGEIYIGGLRSKFVTAKGALSSDAYFSGCIRDVIVNGDVINFAASTDKKSAVLDGCPNELVNYDIFSVPIYYPSGEQILPTDDKYNEIFSEQNERDPIDSKPTTKPTAAAPTKPPVVTTITSAPPTTARTSKATTTSPTPTTPARTRPTLKPSEEAPLCALPTNPVYDENYSDAGYRFGAMAESRIEFNHITVKIKRQYDLSFQFRSSKQNGLLFYAADSRHIDFIAVYLRNGKIYHTFNCGSGLANVSSTNEYSDNNWHSVAFSRSQTKGKLVIDTVDENHGETIGNTKIMSVQAPFYFGGIDPQISSDVTQNILLDKNDLEFVGCIRNIEMASKPLANVSNVIGVQPCTERVETGVFFDGSANTFVKLYNKFLVGNDIIISLDIKPRDLTGLLLSVHGGKNVFFILQMINGTIQFSVDNGDGAYTASFIPDDGDNFCDGNWRTVQAIKSKFVLSIKVNDFTSNPAVGSTKNTKTVTTRPLFLGGHPHIAKIRGVTARKNFEGCIRNVNIRSAPVQITNDMLNGNVQNGVCPTF